MTSTVIVILYENITSGQLNYTKYDLEAINNSKALTLLPAMLVLGILMIVGILGNSLVCYVFGLRLQSGTQNFLIVCLAVFDLLSCLIAIPNEIADMRFYFDFQSTGACKIMRFINTFCTIGSIFTLIVIAIDRYRKICKPFSGQLHMTHVRLSLIPIFGLAMLFSWPAFIMYGLRTTETEIPGLNGQDCSTADGIKDTMYPLFYNCVLFLCFIIIAITLIIIYTLVLRETKRHNSYLKRNSDYNIPSSGQYYSEDSNSNIEVSPGNISSNSHSATNGTVQVAYGSNSTIQTTVETSTEEQIKNVSTLREANYNDNSTQINTEMVSRGLTHPHRNGTFTTSVSFTDASSSSQQNKTSNSLESPLPSESNHLSHSTDSSLPLQQSDNSHTRNPPSLDKRSRLSSSNEKRKKDQRIVLFNENASITHQSSVKRRIKIKSKTTMIAFLVTLVFILSFLPHLSLQVTKMVHKGFDYNLQGSSLVAYNIFLRSYFINSVSNPIIYGVLNAHFRNEVKLITRKVCRTKA